MKNAAKTKFCQQERKIKVVSRLLFHTKVK